MTIKLSNSTRLFAFVFILALLLPSITGAGSLSKKIALAATTDPYEPNDSEEEAYGPLVNGVYEGLIYPEDDPDCFWLDVPKGCPLLKLTLTSIPAVCDYDLLLFDSAMNLIQYSANASNQNELIEVNNPAAGKYYVIVISYSGSSASDTYRLGVLVEEPQPSGYTFYFAEGCTRSGFHEYLCMMNPHSTAVTANITYMFPDGSTQTQALTIGKYTRATVMVNNVVGEGRDVSARIETNKEIIVERPMYFNYFGWDGGHDVVGAVAPQKTFYFAEGCTRDGFHMYLCIMNPNNKPTTAHITYMFSDGSVLAKNVEIGPTTRTTIGVNSVVGNGRDVSVRIVADDPIVAERPMYFRIPGAVLPSLGGPVDFSIDGGHDAMGAVSPQKTICFAEGYTGNVYDLEIAQLRTFTEYLCLMNPNSRGTNAHITYMFTDGSTMDQDIYLGATTRATVCVNDVVGPEAEVSVRIEANEPIVAERPMYFIYEPFLVPIYDEYGYPETVLVLCEDGHVVMGTTSTAKRLLFAEGYTSDVFHDYICLMNPNSNGATATITFKFDDGTTAVRTCYLEPTSRKTVMANEEVGNERSFGIDIQSDQPIFAERATYFVYSGYLWGGGHCETGYAPKSF